MHRRVSPHIIRTARVGGALLLLAAAAPTTALAVTQVSGSQSVTADINDTLEASFPSPYAWGNLDPGTTANVSAPQTLNVKSNSSWGAKASTDQTGGQMKEWTGGNAYVTSSPKVLTNPLNWRLSSLGGVAQGTSFAAFTSSPALVTGSQGPTGDTGVDVSLTYRQLISYADLKAGANDYRILVSFDVSQGY